MIASTDRKDTSKVCKVVSRDRASGTGTRKRCSIVIQCQYSCAIKSHTHNTLTQTHYAAATPNAILFSMSTLALRHTRAILTFFLLSYNLLTHEITHSTRLTQNSHTPHQSIKTQFNKYKSTAYLHGYHFTACWLPFSLSYQQSFFSH